MPGLKPNGLTAGEYAMRLPATPIFRKKSAGGWTWKILSKYGDDVMASGDGRNRDEAGKNATAKRRELIELAKKP